MRTPWTDEESREWEQRPRERDSDSSLQAQYEDSVLPDRDAEHDEDS